MANFGNPHKRTRQLSCIKHLKQFVIKISQVLMRAREQNNFIEKLGAVTNVTFSELINEPSTYTHKYIYLKMCTGTERRQAEAT